MSDSPVAILHDTSGNEKGVSGNPVRTDPTGTTAQPISDGGGSITVDGAVTANAGTGPFPVSDNGGSITVDDGGASLTVDGPLTDAQLRATAVPVSGTVTANAGTGPFPVSDNGGSLTVDASSLPLPTGAATSAKQDTGNTLLSNIDTKTPALGQAVMAASSPVVMSSDQSAIPVLLRDTNENPLPIIDRDTLSADHPGLLAISKCIGGWTPEPKVSWWDSFVEESKALQADAGGQLQVRGQVLTDEGSFHDDFSADLDTAFTNNATFVNGSTAVTGTGFLAEGLDRVTYIKLDADGNEHWALVARVLSDTALVLVEGYTGTSTTGAVSKTYWPRSIGTGTSYSVADSVLSVLSGTTSGAEIDLLHGGDYLPMQCQWTFQVSQRIANQRIVLGFYDDLAAPSACAAVEMTGTSNTQLTFVTRSSAITADLQSTTVTLPSGYTTASWLNISIEVFPNEVNLFLDQILLARHRLHIPGSYVEMKEYVGIINTGVPSSSTTVSVDLMALNDYDLVAIGSPTRGNPIPVEPVRQARSSVANVTSVAASVTNQTLLAVNSGRTTATFHNESVATLYLKLGATATTSSFTVKLNRYDYYELPAGYTGRIDGLWSAATGSVVITELS